MSKDVIRCLMHSFGFSKRNAELALEFEAEGNLCHDEEDFLNRVRLNPNKAFWTMAKDIRVGNMFNFRLSNCANGADKTEAKRRARTWI